MEFLLWTARSLERRKQQAKTTARWSRSSGFSSPSSVQNPALVKARESDIISDINQTNLFNIDQSAETFLQQVGCPASRSGKLSIDSTSKPGFLIKAAFGA
jgi:hypothetical protein